MEVEKIAAQFIELYDKLSSWEQSVVKDRGLSPAQMHTIEVIGHQGDIRMKELAERLGITTGTLTIAVDRLEKQGLVLRQPNENDRRSYWIVLTDKGKKMFEEHHRFHLDFTTEMVAELSSEELLQFSQLFARILAKM